MTLVLTFFTWGETFSLFPSVVGDYYGRAARDFELRRHASAKGVASIIGGGRRRALRALRHMDGVLCWERSLALLADGRHLWPEDGVSDQEGDHACAGTGEIDLRTRIDLTPSHKMVNVARHPRPVPGTAAVFAVTTPGRCSFEAKWSALGDGRAVMPWFRRPEVNARSIAHHGLPVTRTYSSVRGRPARHDPAQSAPVELIQGRALQSPRPVRRRLLS